MKELTLRFRAILFLTFAVLGLLLEWGYGIFWSKVGDTPWVYPNSPLHYSSLEGMPLWGLGCLFTVSIYRALVERRGKELLGAAASLVLAVLWILIYTWLIQAG